MPTYEVSPMFQVLMQVPIEQVPLYAVLTQLHQASSGGMLGTCVVTCHQVAGALQHLGFTAEPMAAAATVYRSLPETDGAVGTATQLGVADRPPTVAADGTTDGHMVVHAASFGQMIDPTIAQNPSILRAAYQDPLYCIPAVVPVPADPARLATAQPIYRYDEALHATWVLLPQWTHTMDAVLAHPGAADAARQGAAALAQDAVTLIQELIDEQGLRQLSEHFPQLQSLLPGIDNNPQT